MPTPPRRPGPAGPVPAKVAIALDAHRASPARPASASLPRRWSFPWGPSSQARPRYDTTYHGESVRVHMAATALSRREDGQRSQAGGFNGGQQVGVWKRYCENGQIGDEGTYAKG